MRQFRIGALQIICKKFSIKKFNITTLTFEEQYKSQLANKWKFACKSSYRYIVILRYVYLFAKPLYKQIVMFQLNTRYCFGSFSTKKNKATYVDVLRRIKPV